MSAQGLSCEHTRPPSLHFLGWIFQQSSSAVEFSTHWRKDLSSISGESLTFLVASFYLFFFSFSPDSLHVLTMRSGSGGGSVEAPHEPCRHRTANSTWLFSSALPVNRSCVPYYAETPGETTLHESLHSFLGLVDFQQHTFYNGAV